MSSTPSTKLKYYRIRRNRAFFEPGKTRALAAGWTRSDGSARSSIPLGLAGDNSEQEALRLYHKLRNDLGHTQSGSERLSNKYGPGTFGDFVVRFRSSDVWRDMEPRTREDYTRTWPEIENRFAAVPVLEITPAMSNSFHREIKAREQAGELSSHKRFRILKTWRALLSHGEALHVFDKAPIGNIKNPQPAGASAIWYADEVHKLIKIAEENGFDGMAMAIRIGWETLLSPCDVRNLSRIQIRGLVDGDGYVDANRQKTGKHAQPYLSHDLVQQLDDYLERLNLNLGEDDPILRMRSGVPYSTKDTFSKDFRAVRNLTFRGDGRSFKDLRRSGNLEADLGNASPEERAELLANTLHKNGFLEATYTPATVSRGKIIRDKRVAGRAMLEAEKRAKSRNGDSS